MRLLTPRHTGSQSLSPHEKRVCIHFVRHWMERNRKQNQVRLNKALSQWLVATGKQVRIRALHLLSALMMLPNTATG